MVVVAKKNGIPRRTVDLLKLNEATLRETRHTATPFNVVSTVPGDMKKTVSDAWNGYHSIPLTNVGDVYTRYFDDTTNEKTDKIRCVDDICGEAQ